MALTDLDYKESGFDAPAMKFEAAVLSNTEDLPAHTRGIAFSATGAIHILRSDGTEVTIPSGVLAAGMIHPLRIRRIYATGTTAVDIWIFW